MQRLDNNMENELPAFKRLNVTLGILHLHLILSGLLDVAVGAVIAHDIHGHFGTETSPLENQVIVVWLVGIPLILTGVFGLYTLRRTTKIVTVLWIIIATGTNVGVFIYVSIFRQTEAEMFGVNLHVYGQCITENTTSCLCHFPEQSAVGVLLGTCDDVRLRTTLFLVLVSSFSLALATLMIALFLTPVKAFWVPTCLDKKEEDLRMYTTHESSCTTERSVLGRSRAKSATDTGYSQPLLPASAVQQQNTDVQSNSQAQLANNQVQPSCTASGTCPSCSTHAGGSPSDSRPGEALSPVSDSGKVFATDGRVTASSSTTPLLQLAYTTEPATPQAPFGQSHAHLQTCTERSPSL